MDGRVVPDDQKTIASLAYQVLKTLDRVQTVQGILAYQRIDLAFGCYGTHYREMVARLQRGQDRRMPSGSVRLDHARKQIKARFIPQNEIKTEASGFLFKSGPSRKPPALNGGFIALDRTRDGDL